MTRDQLTYWGIVFVALTILTVWAVWHWSVLRNDASAVTAGVMRLNGPQIVRADIPKFENADFETEIKIEDVPPLPLDLSENALEKQRAKMSKDPCADWRDCINGFPEDRYGSN
jgi:hypothetical protein